MLDQVVLPIVLEGILEVHDARVLERSQNADFTRQILLLSQFDHLESEPARRKIAQFSM